jgi:hypothetical protein
MGRMVYVTISQSKDDPYFELIESDIYGVLTESRFT